MVLDYYELLGINRGASIADVRKAYRKKALQLHPSKSVIANSFELFKDVSEAYEVLSDENRRAVYDHFGIEALKQGIPAGEDPNYTGYPAYQYHGDPYETFSQFFGGSNVFEEIYKQQFVDPKGGIQGLRYGPIKAKPQQDAPIEERLELALEEFYMGTVKKINITRKIFEENQTDFTTVEKTLDIVVRRGYKAGTKIIFQKQGDERGEEKIPADVVFTLLEKPHPHFKRDGQHLIYTHTMNLLEALTGTIVKIKTLDGRELSIPVHEVVNPNFTKIISGEGMPNSKDASKRGDLIVKFKINFPTYFSETQKTMLKEVWEVGKK
ncbi:DnaJ-like protein subfamily b member 13 [Paraphysoderma sedebokerense]|nr:DnaJ-like protein subfamily b member 13 [Paraphysoderma sedebokerense]